MEKSISWENINWDEIKEALKSGVVEVTFVKADKSIRVMQATLAEYLLPETGGGRSTAANNPDIIVVFDLEANAWRSFKKSTVIEVEIHGAD